ncbi:uncharacterized protein BO66DRAFT_39487 [Aspergillus aculeatinus CBS 121060]|uniref:Uncharacterized protein n=1 Tax=Aspergillus aculeatinus CBS 121060 TaxID=1448322 RepID=A0ACD1HEH4_9EURO|nr:hypothetical protein BO66DRAFT_39487 [Aspergillus aculeatinus CBS 121060]RAH72186.1 hypothetical protein BO66DRAFT_39487 [Aspergillus aculeatinus CBS 121060]
MVGMNRRPHPWRGKFLSYGARGFLAVQVECGKTGKPERRAIDVERFEKTSLEVDKWYLSRLQSQGEVQIIAQSSVTLHGSHSAGIHTLTRSYIHVRRGKPTSTDPNRRGREQWTPKARTIKAHSAEYKCKGESGALIVSMLLLGDNSFFSFSLSRILFSVSENRFCASSSIVICVPYLSLAGTTTRRRRKNKKVVVSGGYLMSTDLTAKSN